MRLIYHGITKNGGIVCEAYAKRIPPFLVAIPPQPTAVHSPPKGSENPSVENGDSRDYVDNEWGDAYRHEQHLEMVRRNKPLIATVKDIESVEQLPEALKQARELAQYCGRVILIPKVKTWLPNRYGLGYSIPTSHGGTKIECEWFGDRFVHLLGGSPDDQAKFAKQLNVVTLDGNYAMQLADHGKSAWQGCSGGIKVAQGCYPAMRVSLQKQKEYWHELNHQSWANDPLFSLNSI